MSVEAMKQALSVLETGEYIGGVTERLRQAIEQAEKQEPAGWMPIDTAPTDNKRPLYLARFNDDGLAELDFDGAWEYWEESWEMSHINGWSWVSANGIEEPTHWAYQDEPLPYTAPPKREWVGLTDEEILEAAGIDGADTWVFETAYAIEAKLKEKNHD